MLLRAERGNFLILSTLITLKTTINNHKCVSRWWQEIFTSSASNIHISQAIGYHLPIFAREVNCNPSELKQAEKYGRTPIAAATQRPNTRHPATIHPLPTPRTKHDRRYSRQARPPKQFTLIWQPGPDMDTNINLKCLNIMMAICSKQRLKLIQKLSNLRLSWKKMFPINTLFFL